MITVGSKTYKYTFGEASIMSKDICHITNGQYVATLPAHAPKLPEEVAVQYYNKKLRAYWIKNLSTAIPKHKKENALMYLLGRKNYV